MGRNLFLVLGTVYLVLFLLFPLLTLFSTASFQALPWNLIVSNVRQAFLSAVFALLLAIPFALVLTKNTPFSFLLRALSLVPLVLPQPAMILSLVVLFGTNGLFRLPFSLYGLEGIVLAHALYNFPLAGRIISVALQQNQNYAHVARSLGASRLQASWRVLLPLLFPAFLSAFVVAFAFSFTSFSIPLVFGGVSNTTLEVEIFRALFRDFSVQKAAFLALLQLLIFLPFVLVWKSVSWAEPAFQPTKASPLAYVFSLAYFAAFALILSGPLFRFSPSSFSWNPITNSLALAFSSAFLCLLLWLSVGPKLSRYSFLFFGISPLVLAVAYYGLPHSFLLLALGHSLLAFPLLSAVLSPHAENMRQLSLVASSLGASPFQQLVRVVLPAFSPAFAAAFLFAFGFSLGETGFVLSLSDGFQTLSTTLISAFSSYRFSTGYFYVLLLALFALLASLLVEKLHVFGSKA